MPGLYQSPVRTDNDSYTAAVHNQDHAVHQLSRIPRLLDDFSTDVTQMQSAADPGEVGTESLPTNLAGELQRLRFAIAEMKATTQWYETALLMPSQHVIDATQAIATLVIPTTLRTMTVAENTLIADRLFHATVQGQLLWSLVGSDATFAHTFGGTTIASILSTLQGSPPGAQTPWMFETWGYYAAVDTLKWLTILTLDENGADQTTYLTYTSQGSIDLSAPQVWALTGASTAGVVQIEAEISELAVMNH